MISIRFKRSIGSCVMVVDAREFHAYLDDIGVQKSPDETFYVNRPDGANAGVNPTANRITFATLLRLGGPHEYNLRDYYNRPPGEDVLGMIAESVEAVARQIVDHYRPIEISVRILPKVAAPTTGGAL